MWCLALVFNVGMRHRSLHHLPPRFWVGALRNRTGRFAVVPSVRVWLSDAGLSDSFLDRIHRISRARVGIDSGDHWRDAGHAAADDRPWSGGVTTVR